MDSVWTSTYLHYQKSATLFLLLIFMTPASTRKDASRVPFKSTFATEIRNQMTQLYQVEKLKSQILRGLNLSIVPTPTANMPVPQQPISSILNRLPIPHAHNKHFPDKFVWSEPVGADDDENSDRLLFRMANHKTQPDDINRAKLVLRLRSKLKPRRKAKKTKKKKGNGVSAAPVREVQNDEAGSAQKTKKKGRRVRRGKIIRVKVLVQEMHEKTGRFKRVAVQRVTLNSKFLWVSLPIPATLVSHAVASANHSLVLRIKCKRCVKGKVSIDMVFPRKKSKKSVKPMSAENESVLNPHRPYLIIRTAETSLDDPEPSAPSRSARHVSNDGCRDFAGSRHPGCCPQSTSITVQELGWEHWILYPRSFTIVNCMGYCGDRRQENEDYYHLSNTLPQSVTCQPKKRSSVTVLYKTDSNYVRSVDIPDLLVRSCGCLAET